MPGREVRDALFAHREVGGDLRSLRRELRRTVGGAPLGRGDLAPLAPEREPAAHLPDEASESRKGARSRRGSHGHIAHGGFVLLLHHLDALVEVPAGLQQILARLLHLVLLELHLRLGELEAVLDGGLLGIRGLLERGGEALHLLGVRLELFLRALEALLQLLRLGGQLRRVRLDVAQRAREREIELVIGDLHGGLSQR